MRIFSDLYRSLYAAVEVQTASGFTETNAKSRERRDLSRPPRIRAETRHVTPSAETLFDPRASDTRTAKSSRFPTDIPAKERAKRFRGCEFSPVRVVHKIIQVSAKNSANCVTNVPESSVFVRDMKKKNKKTSTKSRTDRQAACGYSKIINDDVFSFNGAPQTVTMSLNNFLSFLLSVNNHV